MRDFFSSKHKTTTIFDQLSVLNTKRDATCQFE